jgi:HEAT repeat protein
MHKAFAFVLLTVMALGCGREKQPLLSHGQPVSHWVEALHDRDPVKRKHAVTALGHVGTADPEAIPAVTVALKDSDAHVRAEAALALLNIGPAAKDAVTALEAAAKDKDAKVRSYAELALARITQPR